MTAVTPTRRLAHWLRARHDDACLAQGLEVWPTPDIITWADLLRRMFEADRLEGRRPGRWLPESAARLVWERIAERDPATVTLVAPDLVGRAAYESWRRMHAYCIPFSALDDEHGAEADAYARWARQYAAWLSEHGWLDPSQTTKAEHPGSAGTELTFVGFDAMTPAQEAFVAQLVVTGARVTIAAPTASAGAVGWVEYPDREAELDAAARWAAARLDGQPAARLAIVVPGLGLERDQVRRTIERVLVPGAMLAGGSAPESRGFEIAAARSLAERPLIAAALDVLSACTGRADQASSSRLLRSAFLGSAASESEARANLDAYLRREEETYLGLARLARLAGERGCPEFAGLLQRALEAVEAWPRRALPSRWSQLWFDLLTAVGWPGEGLDGNEHQARLRWRELLAEFGACDDFVGALDPGDAAALVRDLVRGTMFEPQESRVQLLVIDPETCAGMRFDGIWVCGLDAARWPGPVSPDPFLPRSWQVLRRMPSATAEIAVADARRLLERLCGSADEVVLSVPQFEDEAPLLPSALLRDLPKGMPPARWPHPAPAQAVLLARPPMERIVDGEMPRIGEGAASRGGVKLIELQSACPFRAQAELRLGARPLEEVELGIDASGRGEFAHAVLAKIWRQLGDQDALRRLDESARRALVRDAIDAELASARRVTSPVRLYLLDLESAWLAARVLELLDADLARGGFSVEAVEQQRSVAIGGLTLDLRIDRVDRLESGEQAVLDYKTGGDADVGAWLGERPRLPQLPLYVEAVGAQRVSAVAFGRVRTGETAYRGLARDAGSFAGLTSPGARGWPKEFASWDEMLLAWRRRLIALAAEHVAGDARLAPDPSQACRYCHLHALCRIRESDAVDEPLDGGDE